MSTTPPDPHILILALIKRFTDAANIPAQQVAQWLRSPDWQTFLNDFHTQISQQNPEGHDPRLHLSSDLLSRLQDLIRVGDRPLASARHIRPTDAPPTTPQLLPAHEHLQQLLSQADADRFLTHRDLSRYPAAATLLKLPAPERLLALRAALERLLFILGKLPSAGPTLMPRDASVINALLPLSTLITRFLRGQLPLEESDLLTLLSLIHGADHLGSSASLSSTAVITAIDCSSASAPFSPALIKSLAALEKKLRAVKRRSMFAYEPTKSELQLADRIARLLDPSAGTPTIDPSEPWSAALAREILTLPPDLRPVWDRLHLHAQSANGSKPSRKWLAGAKEHITAFGADRFRSLLTTIFPLVSQPRTDLPILNHHDVDPNQRLSDNSQQLLKGLAWAAAAIPHPDLSPALGDLGEACFKKIPWLGPRSRLVGNAVLWSLAAISTPDAVAQLTRVSSRLKHASARSMADKAFERAVESTGQSREDLEEISLPTFNLSADSSLAKTVESFTCTVAISPAGEVTLTIQDAAGKPCKTAPSNVKSHPDFKALQKQFKNLTTVFAAQKFRLERLFLAPDRTWSFPEWKSRYRDHPLLAPLTRRLIWQFTINNDTVTAIPHDGRLLRSDHSELKISNTECRIRLWHPSTAVPDEVRAWRTFLLDHALTQPFKQAHREIYLLTDAEARTATYSHRFAAHIIRQHPFAALCPQRGWTFRLMGDWDGHNIPTLHLPAQHLKAEFWVEQTDDGPRMNTTDSGISPVLATDQVRFYTHSSPTPAALTDIHPQLFSEIMRDIDLFIAVCSIGNDPNWNTNRPENTHLDYWTTFAFGNLSATAQTRRETLAAVLPRLAIASQCSLSEKFLVLKGSLRTYKIHLGSANILMEPNDQYLCIVPDRSAKSPSQLRLPFEGDTTLSLILSKAFLLAHDHKITDPSITRQIRP